MGSEMCIRDSPNSAPKPSKPVSQKTYSSAPVLRDLAAEHRRFVPGVVAQNAVRRKGGAGSRLLEPEEVERLDRAGYGSGDKLGGTGASGRDAAGESRNGEGDLSVHGSALGDEARQAARGVAEEMEREAGFGVMMASSSVNQRPRTERGQAAVTEGVLHGVEMEEVEDEGT